MSQSRAKVWMDLGRQVVQHHGDEAGLGRMEERGSGNWICLIFAKRRGGSELGHCIGKAEEDDDEDVNLHRPKTMAGSAGRGTDPTLGTLL
jgi:hypothetical protein